jgi:propane monooxygenase reductase component
VRASTVRFEPLGIEIEADPDESILHGAARHGLRLAHGCREGRCGACKALLVHGHVSLDGYSTFALTDEEREEGYVLLCRAHVRGEQATIELCAEPLAELDGRRGSGG